jgi:hypothetical protein
MRGGKDTVLRIAHFHIQLIVGLPPLFLSLSLSLSLSFVIFISKNVLKIENRKKKNRFGNEGGKDTVLRITHFHIQLIVGLPPSLSLSLSLLLLLFQKNVLKIVNRKNK